MGGAAGLISGVVGFMGAQSAGDGAMAAAEQQAAALRQAATMAKQLGKFNAEVITFNEKQQLADLFAKLYSVKSSGRAVMGNSGVQIGSGSFLSAYNAGLTAAELQNHRTKQVAELSRRKVKFEAEIQATSLLNQANAALMQGQLQQQQASNAGIQSLLGGVGSLFR